MERGAMVLLKEVPDPQNYGCPILDEQGRIVRIIEKPKEPPSPYAVIGIYFYDAAVFDIVRGLKPSARGELEITDVNNAYAEQGLLAHEFLDGWWGDAGASIDAWLRVNNLVAQTGANKRNLHK
jgi:glucose-1-phosphate thymidylyltransferase